MKQVLKHHTVRCPRCEAVIEKVTDETMVYCISCRKWCKQIAEQLPYPLPQLARVEPRRRVARCH